MRRALRVAAERTPGLRRVSRPGTEAGVADERDTPGSDRLDQRIPGGTTGSPAFELAYVRTGPRGDTPVLVVPGGPGLASALPYAGWRHRAARRGLDIVMVEHRGVGLSRRDRSGADLPPAAMRVSAAVDDLAAALDAEGIERAIVYGSSYGSYLAAGFGVRHPARVAGMVLDSPIVSAADHEVEREVLRATLWTGAGSTRGLARQVRRLADTDVEPAELLVVVRAAYELGGPDLLGRLLAARLAGRGAAAWGLLRAYADRSGAAARPRPYLYEFDVVATLAFRELHYAPPPDGRPFDPALTYSEAARGYPAFAGEPFDLEHDLPGFDWPTVVLSGRHDLRTPPVVADHAARLLPRAQLVRLPTGHSALEGHPLAALRAIDLVQAAAGGRADRAALAAAAQTAFSGLPRVGGSARLTRVVELSLPVRP